MRSEPDRRPGKGKSVIRVRVSHPVMVVFCHVFTCWHPTFSAAWMGPGRAVVTEEYSVNTPNIPPSSWLIRC